MKNIIVFGFLAAIFSVLILSADQEGASFRLSSSSFVDGESIPSKYACKGENISPSLEWKDAPINTKSFVLICVDPDAPSGNFIHWIIYNIPSKNNHISEGVSRAKTLNDGSLQGVNDFGKIGYDGPCPPPGAEHHYAFILYALDSRLNILPGKSASELNEAMNAHILAKTKLTSVYKR